MENLIRKSEKMTELLKELQVSTIAEQYRYVIKFEYKQGDTQIFSLHDRVTDTTKIDKVQRLNSWLNFRSISEESVYRVQTN
jgi:hypothetical protein